MVTSGARQKNEEWDPEENGGFAIHDTEGKPPDDPLTALEKTHTALVHTQQVQAPRLDALQSNSEKYNADPYALSVSCAQALPGGEARAEASQG